MAINRGQLTFDAEGTEGGRFHSRVLHVPTAGSGLTIGRGYDMRDKTAEQIRRDLERAGVSSQQATLLARAAGLKGPQAQAFIAQNGLQNFEISPAVQESLFEATYDEMARDVRRICDKADCVAAYGAVDWDALHPAIKDILVDLRYRGDYTPDTRRQIQRHVSGNDLVALAAVMRDRSKWSNVPNDRFQRRRELAEDALAGGASAVV